MMVCRTKCNEVYDWGFIGDEALAIGRQDDQCVNMAGEPARPSWDYQPNGNWRKKEKQAGRDEAGGRDVGWLGSCSLDIHCLLGIVLKDVSSHFIHPATPGVTDEELNSCGI